MSALSPTVEGFRIAFRKPAISLAEIAWRWSIGGAAWFLGAMFLFEYADTLTVHPLERLLLATNQPVLVARAIRRIFEGSGYRFTTGAGIVAVATVFAWIVVASFGRAAVLRSILAEVDNNSQNSRTLVSFVGLNFLRAAVALAALVAIVGSCFMASSVWASTRVSAADAVRLCFGLMILTLASCSVLNWLLSVAAVFVAADAQSTFDAIGSALRLCTECPGALAVAGIWFGLAHMGCLLFAFGAGFSLLGVGGVLGALPLVFVESVIALIYFAVADWLYTARLAAYVAIIRGEGAAESVVAPGPGECRAAVDTTELILSDVPLPAS